MMGERTVIQEALFYEFSLERHFPASHLVRAVDRLVDLPAFVRICGLSTARWAGPRSTLS